MGQQPSMYHVCLICYLLFVITIQEISILILSRVKHQPFRYFLCDFFTVLSITDEQETKLTHK